MGPAHSSRFGTSNEAKFWLASLTVEQRKKVFLRARKRIGDRMDEPTLPPHQPNTFRTWLPRIGAFLWLHKDYTIPVAALLVGIVLGYGMHK